GESAGRARQVSVESVRLVDRNPLARLDAHQPAVHGKYGVGDEYFGSHRRLRCLLQRLPSGHPIRPDGGTGLRAAKRGWDAAVASESQPEYHTLAVWPRRDQHREY